MTASLSDEQALERKKATMGDSLGQLYWELCKELSELHLAWSEYKGLYASSDEVIGVLNEAAPQFFYLLDYLMWHDTLLRISRLTDPPKSRGRKNLSLTRLAPEIKEPALRSEVESLVEEACAKSGFARDWRNRHLAHRDLAKALDPSAHALAPASRKSIEAALQTMAAVLNRVLGHYEDAMHDYEMTQGWAGGSSALVAILRLGVDARRKWLEQAMRAE